MPKVLEKRLKRQAKKKGLSKKRAGAYVYGTMRNKGKVSQLLTKQPSKRGY